MTMVGMLVTNNRVAASGCGSVTAAAVGSGSVTAVAVGCGSVTAAAVGNDASVRAEAIRELTLCQNGLMMMNEFNNNELRDLTNFIATF